MPLCYTCVIVLFQLIVSCQKRRNPSLMHFLRDVNQPMRTSVAITDSMFHFPHGTKRSPMKWASLRRRKVGCFDKHFLIHLFVNSLILETFIAPLQDTTTQRRSQPSHGQRRGT